MRPRVPNAPRNWPLRRLAGKAPSCRPTGSIVCRLEVRALARGRAGEAPAPRGAGPEAGDGSAAQTCSSAHPAEAGIGFGGVLCFQKAKYWDQLPSLSSESKREDATARFLCRGFPYESSRGIPCSAYTGTYPIPGFKAPALRLPTPSGRNLKNSAENLVRMEPGKIATHYSVAFFPATPPPSHRTRGRGRPAKYGNKIKVAALLQQTGQLQEAPSPVYGEKGVILRFRAADLLWRPVGILVRFVVVLHPQRGAILLM